MLANNGMVTSLISLRRIGLLWAQFKATPNVAADDTTDVTNADVEGNANGTARRRGKVVGCPTASGRLNGVDTHAGQDDGKESRTDVATEVTIE